ncbi:hypothetical protein ACRRTK_007264 [Alexandromys fortis]
MKISAVLLGLLLIAVTVSPGELAETDEVPPPVSCCYSLTQWKIPLRMLQSYQNTSAQCPLAAVISSFIYGARVVEVWGPMGDALSTTSKMPSLHSFKTKRGKQICADSTQKWVNDYMKFLDQTSPNLQA